MPSFSYPFACSNKERESGCVHVCVHLSSHAGLFIVKPRGNRFSGVRGHCEQVCVSVQVNSAQTRDKTKK